jgi:dethiobiotin synthetase
MRKIFITGTDTNIGKTYVSVKLLQEFNQLGLKTIGIKPVATGCSNGYNEDALLLQQNSSVKLDYCLINPFSFEPPISPNIACADLTVDKIWNSLQEALNTKADIYIIEGAGGWFAPLNAKETMADLVKKFEDIEIILVVGIRLGCLNHALLTYQAIKNFNLNIAGWIANIIDPSAQAIDENIDTLKAYITEPCLKVINYEHN